MTRFKTAEEARNSSKAKDAKWILKARIDGEIVFLLSKVPVAMAQKANLPGVEFISNEVDFQSEYLNGLKVNIPEDYKRSIYDRRTKAQWLRDRKHEREEI